MSKHTDKYPEFDGSGDWKTWTGKIRPKLFKKKSQAYPDKTLFHLTKLEQTPRERGPLVKHVLKVEYEPRLYPALETDDGIGAGGQGRGAGAGGGWML